MELIVFDLDGTLLNRQSIISDYTRETLQLLSKRNIAYTVATGRTLHAARDLLVDHQFVLPQIYKNGVVIWQPESELYSRSFLLSTTDVNTVLTALVERGITPFVFTLDKNNQHAAYHPPVQSEAEHRLLEELSIRRNLPVYPLSELPSDAPISNISALGPLAGIQQVAELVVAEDQLVAYMGSGFQNSDIYWLDVHHIAGSKGDAVQQIKADLNVERVLCFGDSDNDLSMFACADEAYAPANAREDVKAAATAVIGHHDEDGIAHFLRERFSL